MCDEENLIYLVIQNANIYVISPGSVNKNLHSISLIKVKAQFKKCKKKVGKINTYFPFSGTFFGDIFAFFRDM